MGGLELQFAELSWFKLVRRLQQLLSSTCVVDAVPSARLATNAMSDFNRLADVCRLQGQRTPVRWSIFEVLILTWCGWHGRDQRITGSSVQANRCKLLGSWDELGRGRRWPPYPRRLHMPQYPSGAYHTTYAWVMQVGCIPETSPRAVGVKPHTLADTLFQRIRFRKQYTCGPSIWMG